MEVETSNIRLLARVHVNRYRYRLQLAKAGGRHVREDECQYYLKLWESIADKCEAHENAWDYLTRPEKLEVRDAIDGGELG